MPRSPSPTPSIAAMAGQGVIRLPGPVRRHRAPRQGVPRQRSGLRLAKDQHAGASPGQIQQRRLVLHFLAQAIGPDKDNVGMHKLQLGVAGDHRVPDARPLQQCRQPRNVRSIVGQVPNQQLLPGHALGQAGQKVIGIDFDGGDSAGDLPAACRPARRDRSTACWWAPAREARAAG